MALTGIDHIVMRASNLAATKVALSAAGSAAGSAVIDGGPLPIAFLHPKSTHGAMLQINEVKADRFAEQ